MHTCSSLPMTNREAGRPHLEHPEGSSVLEVCSGHQAARAAVMGSITRMLEEMRRSM